MNGPVIRYRERLNPGPWMFVTALLLIPAGLLVFLPINETVGVIVSVLLYAGAVIYLVATTPTIEVTDRAFRAGRATLPIEFVGEAVAFTGEEAFIARGQQLDARAYTMLRGYVKDVVRVENTDPNDPVPYWLVSTRHAGQLLAALPASLVE